MNNSSSNVWTFPQDMCGQPSSSPNPLYFEMSSSFMTQQMRIKFGNVRCDTVNTPLLWLLWCIWTISLQHCKNWVVNKIKFCLELPHADQAASWIIKHLNFKYVSCLHGSQGGFQFYSVFTGDAECHEWFLWVCAKHLICDYAGVEHEYLFVYLQRSWSGESCQRWLCEEHIQTMICKILVSHQTLTPGYCVSNANESCKSSK